MDFLSSVELNDHDAGLDIFSKPTYTANFNNQSDVIIQPTSPPSDSPHATYTFILGGKDDKLYSIPSSLKIFGRFRVSLQNGDSLTNELLAPVVNFPESIFENIAVSLNGIPISDHGRGYPFKSYITKKLSLNSLTKQSTLLAHYWIEDSELPDIKLDSNNLSTQFTERSKLIQKSQDVHFIFSPLVDILNTEKYIPPRTELRLDLEKGPVSFPLLSPDETLNLKINVLDINMSVRRFSPYHTLAIEHEKRFLSGSEINLPFTRSTIRYRTLHTGILSTVVPSIFTGQLPYSLLVGFLTNEQQSMLSYNPFVFKSHGLKRFSVIKNGVSTPQEGVQVGSEDGSFLRGYEHFIQNTGGSIFNSQNGISPIDYFNKSFFIAYDFTPDFCLGAHNHENESGTIDLCLQFESPTKYPLTLLIVACYENNIIISKNDVKLDYSL